jgi:hypothetical protein
MSLTLLESKEEVITFCNNLKNSGGGTSSVTIMLSDDETGNNTGDITECDFRIAYGVNTNHFTVKRVSHSGAPTTCNTANEVWEYVRDEMTIISQRRRGLGRTKKRKSKGKRKGKSKNKRRKGRK